MGGNTLDMTKGSAWKLIVQFAVPVFLSQVFQQLYNTADALIVGRFLGDEALAAVSASGPLIFLLISFFTGLSMGAGVTISRYFGAGDYDRVSKAIHTDVMLGLISGVILTVVGVWLTPTFLRWMGTAPEVLPDAIAYFRYYFIGVLAVVMYNMCKSIMNALGDSKRPLYYLIISSLTNIVLDLLFIGAFHWGVWAAAVATTISQAVSMILCMIHLMKKGTIYQVELKKLRIDREMLGQIIRYGLPSGVQNSVIGFANVIVQSNINSFGKVAMAAYGAYSKLEGFAFLPVTSFTMARDDFCRPEPRRRASRPGEKGLALRHYRVCCDRGDHRRDDVSACAAACRAVQPHAGGRRTRHAPDANDGAVLLPAGILPRDCVDLPRRRQGLRADGHHAAVLVRRADRIYHHRHGHRPRNSVYLHGLSHHVVAQLHRLFPLLPLLRLGPRL